MKRISEDDDDLRNIAELLYPHKALDKIFVGDTSENDIELIMKINSKRRNLPSVSVPASDPVLHRRISKLLILYGMVDRHAVSGVPLRVRTRYFKLTLQSAGMYKVLGTLLRVTLTYLSMT